MAHNVFLSHSSKDKEVVDAICAWLEREGIHCWMAPRDIRPGASWGASVVHAIRNARVMVLVFSSHANALPQIQREVELAVASNLAIIPLRVEDLPPDDDLAYFLGMSRWLDAFPPPLEKHLGLLAQAVKEILSGNAQATSLPHAPTVDIPPSVAAPMPVVASVLGDELSPPRFPPPQPAHDASMAVTLDSRTLDHRPAEGLKKHYEVEPVGSFTTSLAATAPSQIGVTIPEDFLAAGTSGKILKLVPVEHLGGRQPVELYLATGDEFSLGRSSEADLITCFFPRNETNDLRSRRLSKVHARIVHHDNILWAHRKAGATVHIGQMALGDEPTGYKLRERDQLILAEDYAVEIFYDISLQGTLHFNNIDSWTGRTLVFRPTLLGAVRFEPLNTAPAIRNSCWLFNDVGFGSARGGVLTAGSELAPQQGVILAVSNCFWILNLVNNDKVTINGYPVAAKEVVPLSQNDSVWLGAVRYRVEIA